jgi:hypothetical protein
MKKMPAITDEELRSIIYALTLGERPRTRERWIKKGFKKIHKRGENALFDYWKRRIETNEADLKYAVEKKLVFLERITGAGKLAPPPPSKQPSLPQMLKSASKAAANFARSGFATTDPDTLASRMDTCKACDLWDAAGMAGTGRCRKCGCSTQAKLRMASEKCPLGKW